MVPVDDKKIDYKNFNIDMTLFANENNIYSKTNYLITTSLKNKYTYIFQRKGDSWILLYKWLCTIGISTMPTITGIFEVLDKKPGFGTENYSVKYATRFKGRFYYHSVLYDQIGQNVIDGRLGMALSHGCIRLSTYNAKWIYDNIPASTTVIIN